MTMCGAAHLCNLENVYREWQGPVLGYGIGMYYDVATWGSYLNVGFNREQTCKYELYYNHNYCKTKRSAVFCVDLETV